MSWDRLTNKRPPPVGTLLTQEQRMTNVATADELGPSYYVAINRHLYLYNRGAEGEHLPPLHSVDCACRQI
jgi:hypothetical protein